MALQHTPKKSLGQNFLTATSKVATMIAYGEVASNDIVYEIGPGKGVLTEKLLETGASIVAIEKDRALYEHLQEHFKEYITLKKLTLVYGDILEIVTEHNFPPKYKLVANIPYNITGKIISDFLSLENKPESMILMVQLEVAKRVVAGEGKQSILSIAVHAYGKPRLVSKVSAGSFFPKPKVDSAILAIENISNGFFVAHEITEKTFFKVLKAGFAHKRKKLLRNLEEVFIETNWPEVFRNISLDTNTRAEDIDLNTWGMLTTKAE